MGVSRTIMERIKQRLQAKGIPYREIANRLSVAESTVKRWFSVGNLSLAQLDQLCEALGLTIDELLETQDEGQRPEIFDRKQEEFFATNEKALVVFYLISSGLKPKQIHSAYVFTESEVDRILLSLDKHGLIELGSESRFRILKKIGTWWDPGGPLSRKYYPLIKSDFIMSDFTKENEAQWFFSGALTRSSQELIVKKIDALASEISSLYKMDERDREAKNVTLFIGQRPWVLPIIPKYRKKR